MVQAADQVVFSMRSATSPATSYSYSVGAAGTGGPSGANGGIGAAWRLRRHLGRRALRKLSMVDTLTVNYHWVKPQVGGDPSTWGATLNNDLDAIDAQVFAGGNVWPVTLSGSLNTVPIGAIFIWGSESLLPDNYVECDGSIYNVADMPNLFSVISNTFGGDGVSTFAVPHLTGGGIPVGYAASGLYHWRRERRGITSAVAIYVFSDGFHHKVRMRWRATAKASRSPSRRLRAGPADHRGQTLSCSLPKGSPRSSCG